METKRLKNIAILILLLLNLFLLLLLGYHYLQSRRTQADSAQQLLLLLAAEDIALTDQVDLTQEPLSQLSLARSTATEAAIAAQLLGEEPRADSQGGGIVSYTGQAGSLYFRAGGSFDSAELSLPVQDPAAFAREFCQAFGYEELSLSTDDATLTASARQYISGVPVDKCTVTLTFRGGALTAVSGSHISLDNAQITAPGQLTCATALVRWLDHWRTSGVVCRRVEDIRCIYQLQSSPQSLIPLWQVETDTYTYYVDCATGQVTRG